MRKIIFILTIISILFFPVFSHDLYSVYNDVKIESHVAEVRSSTDFFQGFHELEEDRIKENVKFFNNGQQCSLTNFRISEYDFSYDVYCSEFIENLKIDDSAEYLEVNPYYVNKIYRINYYDNQKIESATKDIEFELLIDESLVKVNYISLFLRYLWIGIEHIIFGLDHIFFILGFFLAATGLVSLFKSITGFTVSHSITLTLGALGILFISPGIVEPLIALSIVIVGLLSWKDWGGKWLFGFFLIFIFGLFHGLGFAGSISEIGFPKEGFVTSLLGFNLGVELGQLGIVTIALFSFHIIRKYTTKEELLKKSLSVVVVLGGMFWLIQRLLF